jgi:hypothetical protein
MSVTLSGLVIGLLATVLIDVWALVLKHILKLPTTNWAMVGRWVGHLPKGQFVHRPIANAAPIPGEAALGWATHYAIGLVYGVGYLWLMRDVLAQTPGLVSAIVFSVVLLVASWFIMLPGLGVGILARRAPRPWLIRGINVSVHVVFGIGLYAGWWLLHPYVAYG